ncbi:LuxR C-terminal-related transcriptional regulator [soil metagenome]
MLERARNAYASHRWDEAYQGFCDAQADGELDTDDLAAYADAAWWMGRTDESLALSEQVYRRLVRADRQPQAARTAIEIGFLWFLRGEATVGSGWVGRAARLLDEAPDCAEVGYLRYLQVQEVMGAGDFASALELSRLLQDLAARHEDTTLCAIGLVLEGIALVRQGRIERGLEVFDEAMLPVHAGAVSPNWAGNLYCNLMGLFFELGDLHRARAWTHATERWCDQHSNAAMFIGICRVHRAQLHRLDGRWVEAARHAQQACDDLADMNVGVVAEGQYLIGDLERLRGDDPAAERAFARAHELGRDPQPALARLRLSQGRVDVATAGLRSALAGTVQPLQRPPLLAAQVEVAAATGEHDAAATAAAELTEIAERFPTPGLHAVARHGAGVARLVAGQPEGALPLLREAWRAWHDLDARYEAARVRADLGRALRTLGDDEAAAREHEAAAAVFADLGAVGDQRELDRPATTPPAPGGLTEREVEVLCQVAEGLTNRQVSLALIISERTVERHLANIFAKLGVASRTEAARVAFEHQLHVRP